jgi:hypothetical protein
MIKPLFRIEQLISALLKGSPDDPVYLKVGSSTYGIKSITDGQIRVTSGRDTQDAAQVVKTLRRYATGTPKGEDTGIAWRIVGVGGGTAIKSVSHDGSRIVVTTLSNEGKAAEAFEAPKSERKTTPGKRAHNSAVSAKVSKIMKDYDKTGKIGSSKPKNRAAAIKQAVAVAYSMVNKEYSKGGKRLPSGVRRAETFDAPMGYAPDGPKPFYGNPRKLVRDRWGNLRFIRRRKDGTYMDNVDFGRSIRMDRQRQAKTWAPGGFRDQGDGSLDLLTSLMGAEEFTLPDGSKVMVEDVSEINDGFEPFDLDGVDFIAWHEELFSMPVNCGICNGPSQYYEDNDNVCMTCDSTWVYDEGGYEGEGYYRKSNMAAESGDTGKWFIIPMQELLWEGTEGDYWNAGTPCAMDPDDFLEDGAEEIYDLDEVFFNVPWPQVYNIADPVVNVDTGEAFLLGKREEEYGSPIIPILIRVKDQEVINVLVNGGNRAFDRPPTFELDSDETISDWDLVVIDGQRHKILVGPWDNDDPDYEKKEMERESVQEEVFARGGLGPAESKDTVWVVTAMAPDEIYEDQNQFHHTVRVFDDEINAKKYFNQLALMNGYEGDLESPEDDWDHIGVAIPQPMEDGDDLHIEIAIKELSRQPKGNRIFSIRHPVGPGEYAAEGGRLHRDGDET